MQFYSQLLTKAVILAGDLPVFVSKMEDHGIPQKRHLLIILRIRDDLVIEELPQDLRKPSSQLEVSKLQNDLPKLGLGLSKFNDVEGNLKKEVKFVTGESLARSLPSSAKCPSTTIY